MKLHLVLILTCVMLASVPAVSQVLYENGPVNGQVDAWTLNFGYAVTDSIESSGPVTGLEFWAWLIPGDTISNIQLSIGSSPFGSDLFDGFVTLTQSNCFGNSFGYNVCVESASFNGPNLNGNAWLTLQNANVPSGDPVYWDENSGIGCTSPGCPSQAQESAIGTIPSEAFTVIGFQSTTTTCDGCWCGNGVSCTPEPNSLLLLLSGLAAVLPGLCRKFFF